MLDEDTFAPKPNYWAALLWRKFMGTTVLDPGVTNGPGKHVYGQCLRGTPGGVAMLVLNTDRQKPLSLTLPVAANRYSLTAATLEGREVQLNGNVLRLGKDDALPPIEGAATQAGSVTFAPASITFLAMPEAGNSGCAQARSGSD